MNGLNLYALDSIDGLLNTLQIVFLVTGISLLVIFVLIFLRGLLRGWKYGTYRLIFLGILIAVALIIVNPVSLALGDFDLSGFNLVFNLNLNNKEYVVKATTLFSTIRNIIYDVCEAYQVKASPSELLDYSYALTTSALKLISIFVMALIIIIFGQLLCLLLWHVAFKRIIPKEKRKIKKLRVVSAFEELALGVVLISLLIMPFTGVANALKNHFKADDAKLNGNEVLLNVNKVIKTYDESIMSKIFFDWTKGSGEDSLDTQLMSFLSSASYGKVETSLISEASTIANVGTEIIKSGLIESFNQEGGLKWFMLLSSQSIPTLITMISNLDLVKIVLPFAVGVAINFEDVRNAIGEENYNFLSEETVNWTDELQNISKIYKSILDAGIINCVIEENEYTATPKFDFTQIYDVISSESNINALHTAFADGKSSKVMNKLITGLVYNVVKNEEKSENEDEVTLGLSDFLPKDNGEVSYQKMLSLDWFRELRVIFDGFHDLNKVDSAKVKSIFTSLPSHFDPAEEMSFDASPEDGYIKLGPVKIETALLTDLVIDHTDGVADVLVGKFDGSTPIVSEDGNSAEGSCLLDSDLLGYGMPKLLDVMEVSINNANADASVKVNFDKVRTALNSDKLSDLKKNYKVEYRHVINVLKDFVATPEGKAFIKDLENHPGLDFDPNGTLYDISTGLVDALMDGIINVDNSRILTAAIPVYVDSILESFKSNLTEFGLSEFKYPEENLGSELSKLFSILKHCKNILLNANSISEVKNATDLVKNYGSELNKLIDIVASSKILNPENVEVKGTKYSRNYNLTQLLNKLFEAIYADDESRFTVDEINAISNLTTPINNKGEYTTTQGLVDKNTESYMIINFLNVLSSSSAVTRLNELTKEDVSVATKVEIVSELQLEELFTPIDSSVILPKFVSSLLDSAFSDVLDLENIQMKGEVSFKNIKKGSWQKEGKLFDQIIYAANNGFDLANIDFLNVDSDLLGDVLRNLASSGIFVYNNEYVFPKFFYSKAVASMDKDTFIYLVDPQVSDKKATEIGEGKDFTQRKGATNSLREDILALETREAWLGEDENDSNSEIHKLVVALKALNAIGGPSGFENFKYESLPLFSDALRKLSNSDSLGRMIIYNGVRSAISDIDLSSIIKDESILDMADANTLYLYEANKTDRNAEIDDIIDIFYRLYDPEYGLIQSEKETAAFNLGNLDPDNLLRPLLTSLYHSKIFGEKGRYYNDEGTAILTRENTIFQELMIEFLARGGLFAPSGETFGYVTPLNSHTGKDLTTIVKEIPDDKWEQEIDAICTTVADLKSTSFVDKNGVINFSILSDKAFFKGKTSRIEEVKTDLITILNDINVSMCLYRVLPSKLSTAMDDLAKNASSQDLKDILNSCDLFFTTNNKTGDDLDYLPYGDNDITFFISSLFHLGKVSDMSFNRLQGVDIDSLTLGIAEMGKTGIFNHTKDSDGLTAFTKTVKKMVSINALKEYFFYNGSPKDNGNPNYYDFETKANYIVINSVGNIDYKNTKAIDAAIDKYISGHNDGSLYTMFSRLSSLRMSSILDHMNDLQNLSLTDSIYLLETLNQNDYFYDTVPNLLSKLTSNESYKIDNIFLDSSNIYYHYNNMTTPNAKYQPEEIEMVVTTFHEFKKAKSELSNLNLKTLNLDLIKEVLIDMSNTHIFYEAGPNLSSTHYGDFEYLGSKVISTKLTVFEQFVFNLYDKTSLASQDYKDAIDLNYKEVLDVDHQAYAKFYKLNENISNFSADTNNSWLNEINSLIGITEQPQRGFLSYAQFLGIAQDSGTIDSSTAKLNSYSPDKLKELFLLANNMKVVPNAARNIMNSLLTAGDNGTGGLGLNNYSKAAISLKLTDTGNLINSDPKHIEEIRVPDTSLTYKVKYHNTEIDLTKYTTSNIVGANTIINFAQLKCPYDVEFTGLDSSIKNVDATIDTLYYLQSNTEMKDYDIQALEDFLNSAWNNSSNSYFQFKSDGTGSFNDYLKEHSTYGVISMLNKSKLFNKNSYLLDEKSVNSKSITLFNLFKYKNTLVISSTEKLDINISIGSFFSKEVNNDFESVKSIQDSFNTLTSNAEVSKASTWMDNFILTTGQVRSYIDLMMNDNFNGTGSDDSKASTFFASGFYLYQLLAPQFEEVLLAQLPTSAKYSPNMFGNEIVAGILKGISQTNLAYINLSKHQFASPNYGDGSRAAYLDSNGQKIFTAAYDGSYSIIKDEEFINQVIEMNRLGQAYSQTSIDISSITTTLNALDTFLSSPSKASLASYFDQYYLAFIYDKQVLRGNYHTAIGLLPNTELIDTDRSRTTYNYLNDVATTFSYGAVAQATVA